MKNSLLAAFAAIAAAFSATAATKAQISFEPGAWSTNDWILVKGPRWSYMHGFVQKEDCIENECPPISGVEIHKKHSSGVYSAMVFKDKAEIGQTVSSVMGFDYEIGYVDNDLPDTFYAGIIGCEGRNRFYDFKIK